MNTPDTVISQTPMEIDLLVDRRATTDTLMCLVSKWRRYQP